MFSLSILLYFWQPKIVQIRLHKQYTVQGVLNVNIIRNIRKTSDHSCISIVILSNPESSVIVISIYTSIELSSITSLWMMYDRLTLIRLHTESVFWVDGEFPYLLIVGCIHTKPGGRDKIWNATRKMRKKRENIIIDDG